jgi:hypothetical protein
MASRCQCSRKCPHILRGSSALLPADRLALLAPIIATLIDAAYGYDADSLKIDSNCGIHGTKAISNSECICRGDRYSATEFVQALELILRTTGAFAYPAGQPNRLREGVLRLASTG